VNAAILIFIAEFGEANIEEISQFGCFYVRYQLKQVDWITAEAVANGKVYTTSGR